MSARNSAIIIHIPHSSAAIPSHERAKLVISEEDLRQELLRMTDHYVEELFDIQEDVAIKLTFPVSRLIVDPERFAEDDAELMASKGMGAVYTKTSDGQRLRASLSSEERQRLLETYYIPYHATLGRFVGDAFATNGYALIIDAHSFPSLPLPCDLDQTSPRPDVCIGTDSFHTPSWLQHTATQAFKDSGFHAELNRPYSGSIVPADFHEKDVRVYSIMIEINRALYMDETTGERTERFDNIYAVVHYVLEKLITAALRQHSKD